MPITAVGSIFSANNLGINTLGIVTVTLGDVIVLFTEIFDNPAGTSITTTGVSCPNVTGWTRIVSPVHGSGDSGITFTSDMWIGTVTGIGAATITATLSGTSSTFAGNGLTAQMFTYGRGPSTTWAAATVGSVGTGSQSTTMNYPSLVAPSTGALYVGWACKDILASGTGPGSTSGFVYQGDDTGNQLAYNVAASGTTAPTATLSPTDYYLSVAAVLTATAPPVLGQSPSRVHPGKGPLKVGRFFQSRRSTDATAAQRPAVVPPATISFFDMEVSVTSPTGPFVPVPLTLGANWQPNDVRVLFVSAQATDSGQANDITVPLPMYPDPPTGFTAAYSLDPGFETQGVYYRYLQSGDEDQQLVFPLPPGWREYMFSTVTVRGVNPAVAPVAGVTSPTSITASGVINVASVSFTAPGTMVFMLGTVPDPGGGWPSWATATGIPTGWTGLVATDKSGPTFYPYDTNPSLNLVGKAYSSSGSTGSVPFPCTSGAPCMVGMYAFFEPAPVVTVTVGVA